MNAKRITAVAIMAVAILTAAALMGKTTGAAPQKKKTVSSRSALERNKARIARGEYLVTILACDDCHTPWKMGPNGPEPDMTRRLSGHPSKVIMPAPPKPNGPWSWSGAATNTAFAGPWGVSYAANLTPDTVSGIGIWNEELFMKTIRSGRHWGTSRPILPPMPWPAFAQMTDEDLKSVYAFLRSIPAVRNEVPEAIIAPPPPAPKKK